MHNENKFENVFFRWPQPRKIYAAGIFQLVDKVENIVEPQPVLLVLVTNDLVLENFPCA